MPTVDPNEHDRFLLRQRIRPVVNQYHFEFRRGDEVLGTHTRQAFKFRDTYTIDMSGDPQRTIDRRMILAIAVGMDALQAR